MGNSHETRLERALNSLEGLSVGDAFGELFFMSLEMAVVLMESGEFGGPPFDFQDEFIRQVFIDTRRIPPKPQPWKWTDDTALALEIYINLRDHERIRPDSLARQFSHRYRHDPARGYGGAMHSLLPELGYRDWREASASLFDGSGSYGNGAAMRGAPIGAYFAGNMPAVVENARVAAQVTHFHPEGVAGGIAVAIAAALSVETAAGKPIEAADFIRRVCEQVPESEVRRRIESLLDLDEAVTGEEVAQLVGSGEAIAATDTVPFCVWCAAQFPGNYEEAIWLTLSGLGDRDTTCAIVGGIVAAGVGVEGIPSEWLVGRETLNI